MQRVPTSLNFFSGTMQSGPTKLQEQKIELFSVQIALFFITTGNCADLPLFHFFFLHFIETVNHPFICFVEKSLNFAGKIIKEIVRFKKN